MTVYTNFSYTLIILYSIIIKYIKIYKKYNNKTIGPTKKHLSCVNTAMVSIIKTCHLHQLENKISQIPVQIFRAGHSEIFVASRQRQFDNVIELQQQQKIYEKC